MAAERKAEAMKQKQKSEDEERRGRAKREEREEREETKLGGEKFESELNEIVRAAQRATRFSLPHPTRFCFSFGGH